MEEAEGFLPWEDDVEMMSKYQDRKVNNVFAALFLVYHYFIVT